MVDRPLGVSVEEQQTRLLRDQLELLKSRLPLQRYEAPQSPSIMMRPEIHVDVPDVAANLAPQFRDLIDSQGEVAQSVEGLGAQGQLILENAKVQTELLDNLDRGGRIAVKQRALALRYLSEAVDELGLVNIGIGTTNRSLAGIDRGVIGLGTQGQLILENAKVQTELLADTVDELDLINTGVDMANRSLASINQGVISVRYDLIHLEDALCKLLGELGTGINHIGDELVATRMAIVDALSEFRDIFLWVHREQTWVRKQILEVLRSPAQTAAYEAWIIAENCRIAGDMQAALKMYKRSLDINPSESRDYFSLGLIHLNVFDTHGAMDYFNTAVRYSPNEPRSQAYYLMHMANIEIFQKNYQQAKDLLDAAIGLDITNLEVWYDLALCCVKLGDYKKAVYYIKNLLYANPNYGFKIIGNPDFAPVMKDVKKILRFKK